jgi:ATP-dependent DNA helicase DinG
MTTASSARLAQAFGRLIRGAGDRGHFVVLSSAFPSRLLGAFPPGTPIRRCTLDEALQALRGHASGDKPREPAKRLNAPMKATA